MRTFLLAKSQGPLHQVLQWILIPMVLGSLDPVGCKRRNAALTSDAADVAGSSGELFSDLLARSRAARTGWDRSKPGREGRRDRGVASSALGPSPPGRASSVLPHRSRRARDTR